LAPVKHLFLAAASLAMTLSYSRHADKSKADLIQEVEELERRLKAKNEEISTLRKKISLYKSI
jgi:uncharacterized protein YlxW (UPF0749 family)